MIVATLEKQQKQDLKAFRQLSKTDRVRAEREEVWHELRI